MKSKLLSILVLVAFLPLKAIENVSISDKGTVESKEKITKYGSCTATRTAEGGGYNTVITCGAGSMLCYEQEGNTTQTGDCALVGDWGDYIDYAVFTFESYQVVQTTPVFRVKYYSTVLR